MDLRGPTSLPSDAAFCGLPAATRLAYAVPRHVSMRFVSLLFVAAVMAGCATETDDDPSIYEDVGAVDDALTNRTVERYGAVTPPEVRVVTSALTPRLGEPLAAGKRLLVIRTLVIDGVSAKLVVDADRSTTALITAASYAERTRAATASDDVARSPYLRSLADLSASTRALVSVDQDATVAPNVTEPFALTVDMCQSRKAWDKNLFEWAVRLSETTGAPVPIGIAMTGGWAQAHPNELEQIVAWQTSKKLDVTWINHSKTHPLHCLDSACRRAEFLTAESVDFDEEVLGLERALLARGLLPSVIFRFPGLIHDASRLTRLNELSLMAIDADAWIAKDEGIKPRAVVLVHGNGNEPPGITGFLRAVAEPARAANLRSGKSALVSPLLIAPVPPSLQR